MITISSQRLKRLFGEFSKQQIVVMGDLMLDRYLWGRVSRISPEAPVPVVDIDSESVRFGGAANVCYNVQTLGAKAIPIGVIGNDRSGQVLAELFREKEIRTDGLFVDPDRPTTVKTRIIAHNQHVVRTDRETRNGISRKLQKRIEEYLDPILENATGVILEDYNKGLFTPAVIDAVIAMAKRRGKMIFVDPKFDHFFNFRKVTLFKPNRKEVTDRLGIRLDSEEELTRAGQELLARLECDAVLITLGDEGMALFEPGKPTSRVPTRAMQVHDVSGAGDTVIATMAVSMGSGADLREAATMANHAAGIVCGEVGIVPVERTKLFEDLARESDGF